LPELNPNDRPNKQEELSGAGVHAVVGTRSNIIKVAERKTTLRLENSDA